jgi:hypothetical protein
MGCPEHAPSPQAPKNTRSETGPHGRNANTEARKERRATIMEAVYYVAEEASESRRSSSSTPSHENTERSGAVEIYDAEQDIETRCLVTVEDARRLRHDEHLGPAVRSRMEWERGQAPGC